MGRNYQDGKYALFVSFFGSFIMTWSQNEPSESREKNAQLGLHCFIAGWLNLKQLIV